LAANLDHEVKSKQSEDVTLWAASLVKVCEAHISDSTFDLSKVDALRPRLVALRDKARLMIRIEANSCSRLTAASAFW
ncbi:hypothetical protein ACC764_39430, partial [Rhizobium ruizarguesonis]